MQNQGYGEDGHDDGKERQAGSRCPTDAAGSVLRRLSFPHPDVGLAHPGVGGFVARPRLRLHPRHHELCRVSCLGRIVAASHRPLRPRQSSRRAEHKAGEQLTHVKRKAQPAPQSGGRARHGDREIVSGAKSKPGEQSTHVNRKAQRPTQSDRRTSERERESTGGTRQKAGAQSGCADRRVHEDATCTGQQRCLCDHCVDELVREGSRRAGDPDQSRRPASAARGPLRGNIGSLGYDREFRLRPQVRLGRRRSVLEGLDPSVVRQSRPETQGLL
jgi:hypothetical protein